MEVKKTGLLNNRAILVWLFVLLPTIGIFLFRKSFDLGLYGDDWQHLYILWRDFFVFHTKSFFDVRSYLNPYFPESLYLGIISHFWGYYPPAYFISSFILRTMANIALYFFSYELTKSKLAAFLTSLVFLVSAAGLQTTDWVFNMNTYAGLALLATAATIYLKIRLLKTFKSWLYVPFIITFTLALAVVPTRMHGAAPFIVSMDLFLTYAVERQRLKFNKYLIVRILMAIGIFAMLIHFKSFGESSYTNDRFNDSAKIITTLMAQGYYAWWLYFLGIIGHLVIPDNLIPTGSLRGILFMEGVFFSIFSVLSSYSLLKSKKIFALLPVLFNLVWLGFLIILSSIDTRTPSEAYFSISLGGQVLFWALWFFLIAGKRYLNIAAGIIIGLIWIILMTIIHWLFTPYFIIETTGRYMTMAAAGMSIFLGTLTGLLIKNALSFASEKESGSKLIASFSLFVPIIFLIVFIFNNVKTEQNYFNVMWQDRNRELTQRTWDKILTDIPKLDPTAPSVFYFTTNNPSSLYGVLTFGFFMRSGLEWRITDDALTPLPVTDYQQLLDMVKTGEPLQTVHGRKKAPVPLSRVYAFDFTNGVLTNITNEVRQKITSDLNL